MKKIILGGFLTLSLLILAGCGVGKSSESTKSQPVPDNQAESSNKVSQDEVLPEPTGKVDDAVNSILDEADSETNRATSDGSDATSAVGGSEDTNNLNNSYDQNAF